jgi:AraC family transcriptional activator of mtrCDE
MGRKAHAVVEYRNYDLPAHCPIFVLQGENWKISDIPSGVLHFHNCVEIGICESDSGILAFPNVQIPFRMGDVTFISGDVPHTTWSDRGTASKWSYLFVDPDELLRPFFPIDKLPNSQLFKKLLYGNYRVIRQKDDERAVPLVKAMIEEMTGKALNYEISVRGLFLAFMTNLMRSSAHSSSRSPGTISVAPALNYINSHFNEDFTIDMLADQCGMSPSHFRSVFRKTVGTGALEYLNHTRILKACSLLCMTNYSVLTISEMVGFRTLSSFNRHFMEIGVAPTKWRKSMGGGRDISILKYSGWLTPPPEKERDPQDQTARHSEGKSEKFRSAPATNPAKALAPAPERCASSSTPSGNAG